MYSLIKFIGRNHWNSRREYNLLQPHLPSHSISRLAIILLIFLLTLLVTQPAIATVVDRYVATTGDDTSNNCSDASTPCKTVAHAIIEAAEGDIIHIVVGTYPEHLTVLKSLDFVGAGMEQTFLDGGGTGRVMYLSISKSFNISDLTIQNGTVSGDGGGIESFGTLNLTRVKLSGNQSDLGGGLFAGGGTFTITDSIVSGNTSTTSGGGLVNNTGGTVYLTSTTISGNTAATNSGGFHNQGGGTATLTNVTVSGNTALVGGGMMNTGTIDTTILNSTITGNLISSGIGVGGVVNYSTIKFKNTIVSGNANDNCYNNYGATWTSQGHNLDDHSTCSFTQTGDLQNTDPNLGTLADNGGYTRTHALLAGSPAIDAGDNTGCPSTDQRGTSRPLDGDGDGTVTCDVGSYELKEPTTSTINSDSPDPSVTGQNVNVDVTVGGAGASVANGMVNITGANTNCSISLVAGTGSCNVKFTSIGSKTITATYTGDANHQGSSTTTGHTVDKANTTTTITSDNPDPSNNGQNVTGNFTVTVNPPGSGTPTGNITVSDGSASCSASVAAGSCVIKMKIAGNRTLTATYAGSTKFNGSSDTENHQVKPKTSNFRSAGAQDGWVLESSETSSVGGSFDATTVTFSIGDDAANKQYRAVLSFNTASLPDTATITSAFLKIKKQGLIGTDPFTTHLGLVVDIRNPFFGAAVTLVASDFQVAASKNNVGTFGTTPSGGWYSVTLSSSGKSYINKTGTTQFRLRFQKDDNDNLIADFIKFYSGNAGTSTNRPMLIIKYYVP